MTAYDFYPNRGGVATYAQEMAMALCRLNCEVHILVKSFDHIQSPSPWDPLNDSVKGIVTPTLHPVPLPRSGYLSVLKMGRAMRAICRKIQPDFVLCSLWLPGALSSLWALRKSKTPVFTAIHAMEILEPKKGLKGFVRRQLSFLKKRTFANVSGFFAVSEFSKNLLLKTYDVPHEKVHVVTNGVNLRRFFSSDELSHHKQSPQSGFELADSAPQAPTPDLPVDVSPRLFTLCRLVPHKGVDSVLKALPKVLETFPKLQYQVAGAGPDASRLRKLSLDLGISNSVQFLGKRSLEDLKTLYQEADLFVMLSRQEGHNVEGFGLVFLEAACFKTPSLGGRSGGVPSAIDEGQTGWLVSPTDIPTISKTLIEILQNPAERQRRGSLAHRRVLECGDWIHSAEKILAIARHFLPKQNQWDAQ